MVGLVIDLAPSPAIMLGRIKPPQLIDGARPMSTVAYDPFLALDALAGCPDVYSLEPLLREARRAARELYALKVAERRDLSPRLRGIMARVDGNEVFRDPRAGRALETIGELVARLM